MKRIQWIFLASGLIALVGFGFSIYSMLWGPDHIDWEDRPFIELLKSGDILPLIIVPIVMVIAAASIIPFYRMLVPREIKNAVTAQAKVLKVWDTGVSVNDNPQVGVLLEVHPPNGAVFQVEGKTLVSRLKAALVQPGVDATIKYDPVKPTRLQIESFDIDSLPSSGAEARLEELLQLRDKGLITSEEYREKREEIIKEL